MFGTIEQIESLSFDSPQFADNTAIVTAHESENQLLVCSKFVSTGKLKCTTRQMSCILYEEEIEAQKTLPKFIINRERNPSVIMDKAFD